MTIADRQRAARPLCLLLALLAQGCAQIPAERANWPPAACVGDVHSYRLTPDGYKWYLDCVNQT
jgi:hypothetical protein